VWCAFAAAVLVWLGGGGALAHADVLFHLLPAVGIGVTDNAGTASSTGDKVADGLVTASVGAGTQYTRALSIHHLDASVLYTKYIEGHGPSALTAILAWASLFKLSSSIDLTVGAQGSVARATPIVTVADITAVTPSAYTSSTTYYLTTTVSQGLTIKPTPRQIYGESLAFSQARTLDSPMAGLPTTNALTGKLSGGWLSARDSFFIEPMASVAFTDGTTVAPTAIPINGQVISADVMARWQHEIGVTWTSQLAAGPLAIYQSDRATAYNFMALAALSYHELPWFASVGVSQAPIPNLYLGAVTLNDEASARAAVPLTRNQLVFLAGFGGYTYARLSDTDGHFHHAFDLIAAGAALTSQFRNRPFALSLVYTISDQRGVATTTLPAVASIERQTLMLTLTGIFSWGPGTLPLFRGGLEGGGL
jgi:hypothetical protein